MCERAGIEFCAVNRVNSGDPDQGPIRLSTQSGLGAVGMSLGRTWRVPFRDPAPLPDPAEEVR